MVSKLEKFDINSSRSIHEPNFLEDTEFSSKSFLSSPAETLITREKRQRLSLIEKLYLCREIIISRESIKEVSRNFFVSKTTLCQILKAYTNNASILSFGKCGTTRSIANSNIICQSVLEFTKNRTSPFTSKEVCTHIKRTLGWNISKEAAIKIMKEHCRLSYKKG